MPLILELIVLMLAAYAAGFGIGWLIWGSAIGDDWGAAHEVEDGDTQ